MNKKLSWCLVVSMMVLSVTGCGRSKLKLADPVPTKGTVMVDDKPLSNSLVYFVPEGAKVVGPGSTAVTDGNGNYELKTVIDGKPKTGAIPGNYRVMLSSWVGPNGQVVVPDGKTPPANQAAREVLPERFSNMMTTELKATVAGSGGTFDFKIQSR